MISKHLELICPNYRLNKGGMYVDAKIGVKCTHHKNIYAQDDVIRWKHFPRYWSFVRGIHRSPVNSPHKDQWRGALMFSLICAWTNDWVNNNQGNLDRCVNIIEHNGHTMPKCFGVVKILLKGGHLRTVLSSVISHVWNVYNWKNVTTYEQWFQLKWRPLWSPMILEINSVDGYHRV